jgi:FkbM family methyltransferase
MIRSVLRKIVPLSIRKLRLPAAPPLYLESYSQEGEDMVLHRFLGWKTTPGFFVDVGAHHPTRFSNTYFFYRSRGWRGINIDAMPGSMEPFRELRPRDINIEAAVSSQPTELTYHVFSDGALNGFDPDLSACRSQLKNYRIIDQIKMKTRTLAEILEQNLPVGCEIDFLTVDVEGLDLQVLKSNDWTKYRPSYVLAEDTDAGARWESINDLPVSRFLREQLYVPVAFTGTTVFFKQQD